MNASRTTGIPDSAYKDQAPSWAVLEGKISPYYGEHSKRPRYNDSERLFLLYLVSGVDKILTSTAWAEWLEESQARLYSHYKNGQLDVSSARRDLEKFLRPYIDSLFLDREPVSQAPRLRTEFQDLLITLMMSGAGQGLNELGRNTEEERVRAYDLFSDLPALQYTLPALFDSLSKRVTEVTLDRLETLGASKERPIKTGEDLKSSFEESLTRVAYWALIASDWTTRLTNTGYAFIGYELEVTTIEFIAVIDNRTTELCYGLHGTKWDILSAVNFYGDALKKTDIKDLYAYVETRTGLPSTEDAAGVQFPPLHYYCRSTLSYSSSWSSGVID